MSLVREAVLLMLEWVLTSLFFDLESESSSELFSVEFELLEGLDNAGFCCGDF